jgi:predicted dehydrogenase
MVGTDSIKIVMIGCGKFSRYYHVPTLEADADVRFEGIFDPNSAEATQELAKRHNVKLTANLDDLAGEADNTLAIVTTPHALHARHVAFALNRNWHVLCDKPFVLSAKEASDLAALAAARSRINGVAFNRRCDPGCVRAREIIRSGGIGTVQYVQTVQLGYETSGWFVDPKLSGGGPFTGRATHMADIVPWLLDRKPTSVRARIRGGTAARTDLGGFIDVMFGELECQMTCTDEGWHMWDEVRIFGKDGMIELRRPLEHPIGWTLNLQTRRGKSLEQLAADPTPGGATRNFLSAVRGQGAALCSFTEAVIATAIVENAFESARSRGAWQHLL